MLSFSKFIVIVIGSLFIAIGINFFLVPYRILDGGLFGISLIFNYILGAQVGLVNILCSIPIFIIAWIRNRRLFYNSLSGMLISSITIDAIAAYQYHFVYYVRISGFSSAWLGGLLIGTGLGIMLRYETSTGGTDLLAHLVTSHITMNMGILILIMDAVIISIGGWLLSGETLFYSAITILAGGIATSFITHRG